MGDDSLAGGAGIDSLDGGAGTDVADYSASPAGVTVNLADMMAETGGDAAGDVLTLIEAVIGSDSTAVGQGDKLQGGAAEETLIGGAGDDTIAGGDGADSLVGGADMDLVSYAASTAAVTVDLSSPAAQVGGHADGDMLDGFEHVMGGAGADELTAAMAGSSLLGGAGNDSLFGGTGSDSLLGGAGDDAYSVVGGLGADTIMDSGGVDTLFLGEPSVAGATPDALVISKLTLSKSGNDLVIQSLTNAADKITIADQYGGGAIENIMADDGDGDMTSRARLTTDATKLASLLTLYNDFAMANPGVMELPEEWTTRQAFTDGWRLPPRVLDYSAEMGAIVANLPLNMMAMPMATPPVVNPVLTPAATRADLMS